MYFRRIDTDLYHFIVSHDLVKKRTYICKNVVQNHSFTLSIATGIDQACLDHSSNILGAIYLMFDLAINLQIFNSEQLNIFRF